MMFASMPDSLRCFYFFQSEYSGRQYPCFFSIDHTEIEIIACSAHTGVGVKAWQHRILKTLSACCR